MKTTKEQRILEAIKHFAKLAGQDTAPETLEAIRKWMDNPYASKSVLRHEERELIRKKVYIYFGIQFKQALLELPSEIGYDPTQHKTLEDLKYLVRHELDLIKEEPESFEHLTAYELQRRAAFCHNFLQFWGDVIGDEEPEAEEIAADEEPTAGAQPLVVFTKEMIDQFADVRGYLPHCSDYPEFADLDGAAAAAWLESKGFTIAYHKDMGTYGLAVTTCGIHLSTNGYIHRVPQPVRPDLSGPTIKRVPLNQLQQVPNVRTWDNKKVYTDGELRYTWKEASKFVTKDGKTIVVDDGHFVELGVLELTEYVPD